MVREIYILMTRLLAFVFGFARLSNSSQRVCSGDIRSEDDIILLSLFFGGVRFV
jgi:hypothetical protein